MSQPFFVRRLTRSERLAIRELRKRPPRHAVFLRAQAVHFSSQRLTAERIAGIVARDRSTVYRWLKAFDADGLAALWPGKSPGRPPVADAEFQTALKQAVEQNPRDLGYPFTRWTVDLLTEHLRRTTHVQVSASTVRGVLKRLDYRYGRPKLDLKHRQNPKDVARAKRQRSRALKKREPVRIIWRFSSVTKPSST
jgi:transposase